MRKILLNAAMLLGALLLFVPLSKAQLQNPIAMTIDPASATVELKKGENKEITLKFVPEANVNKEATVVAEPADKLTVSVENGVLKLVADKDITAETAVKVTVTSTPVASLKAICNVTLKPAPALQNPTAMTIDPASATVELKKGENKEITLKFVPEANVNKEATVVAEPADKLTVSVENGVLKLVADKDITAETAVKVTVTSTPVATLKAICNVTLKPATPAALFTLNNEGKATVKVEKKEGTEYKPVAEADYGKLAANDEIKVTVEDPDGKVEKVTVKVGEAAEQPVTAADKKYTKEVKLEAGKPVVVTVTMKPATPAALFTLKNEGKATVKVEKKVGTEYKPVVEADYGKLAANDEIKVTVEDPDGKVEKVTVKVGEAAEQPVTAADKKYTKELKLEAGKPVVVTVTMKAAALFSVEANGATVVVKNGTVEVKPADFAKIKKDDNLSFEITATAPATIDKVEIEVDGKKTVLAAPYKYKMTDKAAKLIVTVKGAPAASIVELAGNAKDADVKAFTKEGDKFTKATELKDLKAGEEFQLQITAKEGKKITKVEVKVGDAAPEAVVADEAGKYTTKTLKVEAGKKVVVTITTEDAPVAAALLEVKADEGVTVKVEVAGQEVKDFTKIKPNDDLTITVTASANKPVVTVTVKEGDDQPKELTANNGKYTHKMGTKKTILTVTAKTPAEDAVLAAVAVYPNPFVGQLFVANTAEVAKVALVNAQGVVVRTVLPAGANELNIAVEDLPAGVYVLVLEREGARKAIRLVK